MSLPWKLEYMGHSYGGNIWNHSTTHINLRDAYYVEPCHSYSGRPKAYTLEECIYRSVKEELPPNTPKEWIDKVAFGGKEVLPIGADNIPLSAQGHCQAFCVQKVYCADCAYSWLNLIGGETGCVYFEDGYEICPVCGGNTDGVEYDIVEKAFYFHRKK